MLLSWCVYLPNFSLSPLLSSIIPSSLSFSHLQTLNPPPYLQSNSPTEFSWLGRSILGLINGLHTFEFLPSDSTPGGTTFVQKEEFSGWLGFLMTLAVVERKTAVNFGILNQDLKRWVEGKGV